jgi:hypothetical protein
MRLGSAESGRGRVGVNVWQKHLVNGLVNGHITGIIRW